MHHNSFVYIFFTSLILIFCCALCALFGAVFFIVHTHVVDFSRLDRYRAGAPSIVLDDTGCEITRFQLDRRQPVSLACMPVHLINAFIAMEDWQFFEHHGLSVRGIARSVLVNLLTGRKAQGASTITQQLVRLLFFDNAKTYVRKIKEQIFTLLVEMQFTKEYILELYLNHIYCGAGIYGVEAAAQRFWGKSVTDLTLDEAATLAGIICAPNRYCPLLYPLSAQRRRDSVLNKMVQRGFITARECADAQQKPVTTVMLHEKKYGAHVIEYMRQELEEIVGKHALYTEGFIIHTTLNMAMQRQAEEVFQAKIRQLRAERKMPFDGGLVTLDVLTNGIKAYVGGYDFATSQFDRVQQAQRQLGSIFKVIVYAEAVKAGKEFYDIAIDEPVTIMQGATVWSPRNYYRDFKGPMTLAYALSHSSNTVAVKTLMETGIPRVVELALKTHVHTAIPSYPSLALGCVDVSLLNATTLFSLFPAHGIYRRPHILLKIKDVFGTIVWKKKDDPGEIIIDSYVTGKVAKVLQHGMKRYLKNTKGQEVPIEMMAKTGTTNDSRTCWFIGASPSYTTGVYVGCDDNRALGNMFPIHTAFPIFFECMNAWEHKQTRFVYNPQLREIVINGKTGERCAADSPHSMRIFV